MKNRLVVTFALLFIFLVPAAGLALEEESWPAPEFTAYDLNGELISLASLRGKVVLLHFWATWCTSCVKEMPSLEEFAREYEPRGLRVLALTAEGSKKRIMEFFDDEFPPYSVILDEGSRITRLFNVRAIPVTLVVDRSGMVVKFIAGGRDWNSLKTRSDIDKVLEK